MRKYEVYFSINVTPQRDEQGFTRDMGNLMFSRKFVISGNTYSDIAGKIDGVYEAMASLADAEED